MKQSLQGSKLFDGSRVRGSGITATTLPAKKLSPWIPWRALEGTSWGFIFCSNCSCNPSDLAISALHFLYNDFLCRKSAVPEHWPSGSTRDGLVAWLSRRGNRPEEVEQGEDSDGRAADRRARSAPASAKWGWGGPLAADERRAALTPDELCSDRKLPGDVQPVFCVAPSEEQRLEMGWAE